MGIQENVIYRTPFDQTVSAGAIAVNQMKMLNIQLDYVMTNSRFYAERFSGFPMPMASRDDFARMPFTTAEDIQNRGGEMVCVSGGQVRRIVTLDSTGSSGLPKRLYFSEADLARTVDFFAIGMKYLCGPGDSVMICMPAGSENSVGRLLANGLDHLGAKPCIHGIICDYQKAATAIRQASPHTIVGIPSQMRKLALIVPDMRPANVLLSADYISDAARKTISRIWGCEVFTHYGLTESGYGCAVECPSHMGQHIRHDELLLEIISVGGTEPLPYGQWGEIVITTLRREAMPLIRYRTGDMGRIIHDKCACGSELPRLDQVRGRIAELSGGLNIYALDELLLEDDGILDFSASMEGGTLTVALDAVDAWKASLLDRFTVCSKRLEEKWPGLRTRIIPADSLPVGWTAKRRIARGGA